MKEPDYGHDSLCELLLKQREIMERQFHANVELAAENLALRESVDDTVAGEYDRLVEVLLLVEAWAQTLVAEGGGGVDAESLVRVLQECFDYAEKKQEPAWYRAAVRAMAGLG